MAGAKGLAEPKSRGKSEPTDRGRKRPPEAAPRPEHGGRTVAVLGPEPSRILVAPAARALPPPDSEKTGRGYRIPEHLQSGQALPQIAGLGHRLEGSGEPGGPDGRGVSWTLAG